MISSMRRLELIHLTFLKRKGRQLIAYRLEDPGIFSTIIDTKLNHLFLDK